MSDLSASIRDLVQQHGLHPVIDAVLEASREAGQPYGATTARHEDGTLEGHRPCFHCGAATPAGEVWDAHEGGVMCLVRCQTCGLDSAEYYTVESVEGSAR